MTVRPLAPAPRRARARVRSGASRWWWETCSTLPLLVVLIGALEWATTAKVGHREVLQALGAVVLTQVIPGAMVWRAVRPRHGWLLEDGAMGLAIGAALAVPAQVLNAWLSVPALVWWLPLSLSLGLLLIPRSRRRIAQARCAPLPAAWGLCLLPAFVLPLRQLAVEAFSQPLRWSGWAAPYVDMPYHLALGGEAGRHFPPHYPQLASEGLHYHWFAHAWMANISAASGTSLDVLLFRFLPTGLAVAVPVVTAVVAMRITRMVWAGPIAALLVFAVGALDIFGLVAVSLPLRPWSPTLGFGVLILLGLLALFASRWRGETHAGAGAVLLLLTVVAAGAKGTVLPVLLAGLGLSATAAVLGKHPWRRRIVADASLTLVVLITAMVVVFGGRSGGLTVEPFTALASERGPLLLGVAAQQIVGWTAATAVLGTLLMYYLPSLVGIGVIADRVSRRDPMVWLLIGATIAGAGAIVLFDHPGSSQWYFPNTAVPAAGILAAWGLVLLRRNYGIPPFALGCSVLVGALAGVTAGALAADPHPDQSSVLTFWLRLGTFLAVVTVGSAWPLLRRSRPRASISPALILAALIGGGLPAAYEWTVRESDERRTVTRTTSGAIHSSEIRAARWIRDHSAPGDIVMTNRHCRNEDRPVCDHRNFFIAAYSEREVLVEGWAYTDTGNALAKKLNRSPSTVPFWDTTLLRLNDRFITRPDSSAALALSEMGVRWVYVSHRAPRADDFAPFATRRLSTKLATVYELTPPRRDRSG